MPILEIALQTALAIAVPLAVIYLIIKYAKLPGDEEEEEEP